MGYVFIFLIGFMLGLGMCWVIETSLNILSNLKKI